jgi:hypothetical protein
VARGSRSVCARLPWVFRACIARKHGPLTPTRDVNRSMDSDIASVRPLAAHAKPVPHRRTPSPLDRRTPLSHDRDERGRRSGKIGSGTRCGAASHERSLFPSAHVSQRCGSARLRVIPDAHGSRGMHIASTPWRGRDCALVCSCSSRARAKPCLPLCDASPHLSSPSLRAKKERRPTRVLTSSRFRCVPRRYPARVLVGANAHD